MLSIVIVIVNIEAGEQETKETVERGENKQEEASGATRRKGQVTRRVMLNTWRGRLYLKWD